MGLSEKLYFLETVLKHRLAPDIEPIVDSLISIVLYNAAARLVRDTKGL